MLKPSPRLGVSETARVLGISEQRVRQLDDELTPNRDGVRGWRSYDRARVERFAEQRAQEDRR